MQLPQGRETPGKLPPVGQSKFALPRNNTATEIMSAETAVDQMMILSGDRLKLREQLKTRLHSSGWVDEVRLMCRKVITREQGDVSVDQLVSEVTPMARQAVPDTLKKFLLSQIQNILMEADE